MILSALFNSRLIKKIFGLSRASPSNKLTAELLKLKFFDDVELVSGRRAFSADDISLDPSFSYFLLQASFGDKWCILSYLNDFLTRQEMSKVVATEKDRELIRIFLGNDIINRYFIFLDEEIVDLISSFITPTSQSSAQVQINNSVLTQTNSVIQQGFPPNKIRHLHIVKYPYFSDLFLFHGVSYGTLEKMILCLPSDAQPNWPQYYTDEDRSEAENLLRGVLTRPVSQAILFNVNNISHISFDENEILMLIQRFEIHNIQVIINTTGCSSDETICKIMAASKFSARLDIPGHLLALISDKLLAVVGIIGGAMNVAVQFSMTHNLTFYTNGVGIDMPLNRLFGGRYSDNIWKIFDVDSPCLSDRRVSRFVDLSSSSLGSLDLIAQSVDEFCAEIEAKI